MKQKQSLSIYNGIKLGIIKLENVIVAAIHLNHLKNIFQMSTKLNIYAVYLYMKLMY